MALKIHSFHKKLDNDAARCSIEHRRIGAVVNPIRTGEVFS